MRALMKKSGSLRLILKIIRLGKTLLPEAGGPHICLGFNRDFGLVELPLCICSLIKEPVLCYWRALGLSRRLDFPN